MVRRSDLSYGVSVVRLWHMVAGFVPLSSYLTESICLTIYLSIRPRAKSFEMKTWVCMYLSTHTYPCLHFETFRTRTDG